MQDKGEESKRTEKHFKKKVKLGGTCYESIKLENLNERQKAPHCRTDETGIFDPHTLGNEGFSPVH